MKKYRDAYTKKLSNPKKVPQDVQKDIEVLCYIVLGKYLILEELVLQNKYYICHFFGYLNDLFLPVFVIKRKVFQLLLGQK